MERQAGDRIEVDLDVRRADALELCGLEQVGLALAVTGVVDGQRVLSGTTMDSKRSEDLIELMGRIADGDSVIAVSGVDGRRVPDSVPRTSIVLSSGVAVFNRSWPMLWYWIWAGMFIRVTSLAVT